MGQNLEVLSAADLPDSLQMDALAAGALEWFLGRLDRGAVPVWIMEPCEKVTRHRGMHFHAIPELFLQLSGRSVMTGLDETVTFTPGSAGIVPRGVPHHEQCDSTGTGFRNMVFHLDRGIMSTHLAVEGRNRTPQIVRNEQFMTAYDTRVNSYLDDLVHHRSWHDRPGQLLNRGLMTVLLSHLLGILKNTTVARKKEHFKVARCRQLVAAHLSDQDLCVRMLAGHIGCSSDYLSHLFRAETGVRLIQYINDERVKHACHLLANTALNIGEIAWASGFYDVAYFSRVFRGIHGVSPGRYRQQLKVVG